MREATWKVERENPASSDKMPAMRDNELRASRKPKSLNWFRLF